MWDARAWWPGRSSKPVCGRFGGRGGSIPPHSALRAVTYNTFRERNGPDPALDALLARGDALLCLQEVSPSRARRIRRELGPRARTTPVKHGAQFLAMVLPEGWCFVSCHTFHLNSLWGLLPRFWSLRRGYELYKNKIPTWGDSLEPRAAQLARISCGEFSLNAVNTHLPYERGLRDRCLSSLSELTPPDLLLGDLNATPESPAFQRLLATTGLAPAGTPQPTHDGGLRIDYVLHNANITETSYSLRRGKSDHRVVEAELEVQT